MNNRKLWFPILAASLALCLPQLAQGQPSAAEPAARNIAEMKFGQIPGLPTCMSGVVQSDDLSNEPFIVLVKLTTGCSIPWRWHTAGENLIIVSGTGGVEMKDGPSQTFRAGGFALLPSHRVHQFLRKTKCAIFFCSDGAFDIHYVDAPGTEISPGDALKVVKEYAVQPVK